MKRELREAAQKIVNEAKNYNAAANVLAEKLESDKKLRVAAAMAVIDTLPRWPTERRELHARRREGPHRSPKSSKLPTKTQKEGAIRAAQSITMAIFDRKIRGGKKLGDVKMYEIRAISEKAADDMAFFLNRGFEDGVEAFGMTMLARHCVAADPDTKLRDLVKPVFAQKCFQEAAIKVAEFMANRSKTLKHDLIAAAQTLELPAA